MVQKFCENDENHAKVNFCDKNFVVVHGEPTPTAELQTVLNFCVKKFCDWMSNHEIYENSVPQKVGTIW